MENSVHEKHTPEPVEVIAPKPRPKGAKYVEAVIFNVKGVLPLFYLGLAVILALYGFTYAREIGTIALKWRTMTTEDMKIVALDFIDLVMVANLVKMSISGSYNSFVSRKHGYDNENISSGMLKVKISTSIIVVASINLLRTMITGTATFQQIEPQLAIFICFLLSALVLGHLEFLHIRGDAIEKRSEHNEK